MQQRILAVSLALLTAQPAVADDHATHLRPQTVDYALILPANLPHLLRTSLDRAETLGLNDAQRAALRELMAEAPLKVFSRLSQAEKMEQAIAREVLDNTVPLAELQSRLDALVALKRGATEAQIATIKRMQAVLGKGQFRALLKYSAITDRL